MALRPRHSRCIAWLCIALALIACPSISAADPAHDAWREQQFSIGPPIVPVEVEPGFNAMMIESGSLIGLDTAHANHSYRGSGYGVAVLDTGVDYTHTSLGGGFGNRVLAGWDYVNDDGDPMDDQGHGTHVAGIIGSSHATYKGVAPSANILALKVLDSSGSGNFGDVEDALQWVVTNQATYNIVAVNMSLGTGNYTSNPFTFLDDEFTSLLNAGVFISVSSGNDFFSYTSAQGLGYPSIDSQTVSVGAVWDASVGSVTWSSGARDNTTGIDRITSFTQRSSLLDIVAPGAFVTSTQMGGGTTTMGGTSMAAPVVAGASVLMHEAFDGQGQSAQANQSNILSVMKSTGASVLDGDDEDDNVINSGLTFKRLNLASALDNIVGAGTPTPTASFTTSVTPTATSTGTVTATPTPTSLVSQTPTASPPPTATATATATNTPTSTYTNTPTPTFTPSPTNTATPTPTPPPTTLPSIAPTASPDGDPTETVSGQILNAAGEGAAGVVVYCSQVGSALTDSNGNFSFGEVRSAQLKGALLVPQRTGLEFEPPSIAAADASLDSPLFLALGAEARRPFCTSSDYADRKVRMDGHARSIYDNFAEVAALLRGIADKLKQKSRARRILNYIRARERRADSVFGKLIGQSMDIPEIVLECSADAGCSSRSMKKTIIYYRRSLIRLRQHSQSLALQLGFTSSRHIKAARKALRRAKRSYRAAYKELRKLPRKTTECL